MTGGELCVIMRNRLGRPSDANMLTILQTEMQNIQESQLESHPWYPWFLLTEMESASTEVDEDRLPIPEDFLSFGDEEEGGLWIYDAVAPEGTNGWMRLRSDTEAFLRASQIGTGKPKAYALSNGYFILKPTPNDIYSIKIKYYARDSAPTTGSTNKWITNARDVLMYSVMAQVASEYMQNTNKGLEFTAKATQAWTDLYKTHIARQQADGDLQMGDGE